MTESLPKSLVTNRPSNPVSAPAVFADDAPKAVRERPWS